MRSRYSFKLLIASLLPVFVFMPAPFCAGQEIVLPAQRGYLNDLAEVIDASAKLKIEKVCKDLREDTGFEMVLVTVNATSPLEQQLYTDRLFDKWKVGEEGKGDGVLVVFSIVDKKVECRVGKGLLRMISEEKARETVDYAAIAYLSRGEFSAAMLNTAKTLSKEINDRYLGISNRPPLKGAAILPYVLLVMALVIVVSILLKTEYSCLLGGVGGAVIGFLFFQTMMSVTALALAGFLLGYGDAIIKGRRSAPRK